MSDHVDDVQEDTVRDPKSFSKIFSGKRVGIVNAISENYTEKAALGAAFVQASASRLSRRTSSCTYPLSCNHGASLLSNS
jgi:hypothetical protein